jgi:parallel beta-helix repeat protein
LYQTLKNNKKPKMRSLFIAVLLSVSIIVSATDYYVSSSGADKNIGTTPALPWQSVNRVNSFFPALKPGDRILFRRGDIFFGTLKIPVSGTKDSPIIIGSYGTGKNPVITGFKKLTGWNNEGNSIYSKSVTSESAITMVVIDGKQYGMGRFPNNTYLKYESHKSNSSITDDQLPSSPDWTGAEVVINKQNWLLDRCLITNHSGSKIDYTSYGSDDKPADNRGYFIQNDLRTLDTYGEWYFNKPEGKLYMYFDKIDPETETVEIATVNNLIYNYVNSYIILDGLSFEGSIENAVYFEWCDDCVIKNCTVTFSGESGMDIRGKNNKIINNNISWSNKTGIYIEGANCQVIQNEVEDIGLIPGSTTSSNIGDGIFAGGENSLIQLNKVDNVGRMGIRIGSGWITKVKNNFVNNFLVVLNDGGGIYLDGNLEKERIVEGNIVLNGKGNSLGVSPAACGIYLDEYVSNAIVKENTVAYNPYGINLHKANSNTIENNLCFDNKVQISLFNTSFLPTIYGNKINNNIFFAKESTALVMFFRSLTDNIPHFGEAENNYYARPVDDDRVFFTLSPLTGQKYRTLEEWQSFTHQDANSHKSPVKISDTTRIDFYYNASETTRTITLAHPMIDIKGTKFQTSVTLAPYTSVVLMEDPSPAKN